jgi:hypothetical protein
VLVLNCLYANRLTFIDSWGKLLVSNLCNFFEKILEQNYSIEYREIMTARSYPLLLTGRNILHLYSVFFTPICDIFYKRYVTIITID